MRVAVTGGTGFVGRQIVQKLFSQGHTVNVLSRHIPVDPHTEGLTNYAGNVITGEGLGSFLEGCDALIHLVGIIRETGTNSFEAVHYQGTVKVLQAARNAGIRRYLHMSALGTRKGAKSGYHRTKWAGEEAVRRSGLSWTIFRPSIIFGPGDEFVTMLADTLKKTPMMPIFGGGNNLMQPVHVRDVATAFAAALERSECVGKLYELAGPSKFTFKEILNLIAQVIGKKRIYLPVPMWLAMPPVTLFQALKFPLPVTTDQLQMLQEDNIRRGGDDIEELGIQWTGFEEGIKQYLTAN
jgi:uncharacterized protein YbjT (DUF2867 family)